MTLQVSKPFEVRRDTGSSPNIAMPDLLRLCSLDNDHKPRRREPSGTYGLKTSIFFEHANNLTIKIDEEVNPF